MLNNEIRKTAKKFLKETKGKNDFVSVENYLKKKGYKVIFFNTVVGDKELERYALTQKAKQSSAFTYVGTAKIIFIDNDVPNDDKNYLLYHETGHIELGHIDYERMSTKNNYLMEFEADTFAHFILNPPRTNKHLVLSYILSMVFILISFYFGVCTGKNNYVPMNTIELQSTPVIENVIIPDKEIKPEKVTNIVFVTKTGKKYHRETCGYLKNSKIEMLRADAEKKYTPCKVCNP